MAHERRLAPHDDYHLSSIIIIVIIEWVIPVNTLLLRNSNCLLRGVTGLNEVLGVLKLF